MAGAGDELVGALRRSGRSAARPARCRTDDDGEGAGEGADESDALAAPPPDAALIARRKRGRNASPRARSARRRGSGDAARDGTRRNGRSRRAGVLSRGRGSRGRDGARRNVDSAAATEDAADGGMAGDVPDDAALGSAAGRGHRD